MGSLHSNVHFNVRLTHEPCLRRGRKDLVLGSEQEEESDHGQVFGRYLLGHQRRL